jgi:hypothetical protein
MIAQVARRHQPKADRKITSKSSISKIQKAYYELQRGLFFGLSQARRGNKKIAGEPSGLLVNGMALRLNYAINRNLME